MRRHLPTVAKHFNRSEHGVAGIEFALCGPLLVATFLGTVTLFTMFREAETSEKATFILADMISRQPDTKQSKLETFQSLFREMIPASHKSEAIRVSSVQKKADGKGTLTVLWSCAAAPFVPMTDPTIPKTSLPDLAEGDSFIVVETKVGYDPLFASVGLPSSSYEHIAVNRPRSGGKLELDPKPDVCRLS